MFKFLPALLVIFSITAIYSQPNPVKSDTSMKVIAILPAKKVMADSPTTVPAAPKLTAVAPTKEKNVEKETPGRITKSVKALVLNFFEGKLVSALPENVVSAYDTFEIFCRDRQKITVFNPKTCEFETASDNVTTYRLAGKVIYAYSRGGEKIKKTISDTTETHKSRPRNSIKVGQ
jgi:hypothetical protein